MHMFLFRMTECRGFDLRGHPSTPHIAIKDLGWLTHTFPWFLNHLMTVIFRHLRSWHLQIWPSPDGEGQSLVPRKAPSCNCLKKTSMIYLQCTRAKGEGYRPWCNPELPSRSIRDCPTTSMDCNAAFLLLKNVFSSNPSTCRFQYSQRIWYPPWISIT